MSIAAIKHYEELLKMTVGDILTAFKSREHQQIDISAWMTFFGCAPVQSLLTFESAFRWRDLQI